MHVPGERIGKAQLERATLTDLVRLAHHIERTETDPWIFTCVGYPEETSGDTRNRLIAELDAWYRNHR